MVRDARHVLGNSSKEEEKKRKEEVKERREGRGEKAPSSGVGQSVSAALTD